MIFRSNRIFRLSSALLIVAALGLMAPSCSRKSGCPAEDAMIKTNKDGSFKKGKTSSGLLPKNARKKSKG